MQGLFSVTEGSGSLRVIIRGAGPAVDMQGDSASIRKTGFVRKIGERRFGVYLPIGVGLVSAWHSWLK
jgi:hypothetical protein